MRCFNWLVKQTARITCSADSSLSPLRDVILNWICKVCFLPQFPVPFTEDFSIQNLTQFSICLQCTTRVSTNGIKFKDKGTITKQKTIRRSVWNNLYFTLTYFTSLTEHLNKKKNHKEEQLARGKNLISEKKSQRHHELSAQRTSQPDFSTKSQWMCLIFITIIISFFQNLP